MLYVRGNKRDYDRWAAEGNTGWSFDDVLPYFKKSEDNRNPYVAANTKYHSTGGYLTIQEPAFRTPLLTAFIEGGVEMGYDNIDANAAQQTGLVLDDRQQNTQIIIYPLNKFIPHNRIHDDSSN
jgi:choline dehydrogenase-like flavoprotein